MVHRPELTRQVAEKLPWEEQEAGEQLAVQVYLMTVSLAMMVRVVVWESQCLVLRSLGSKSGANHVNENSLCQPSILPWIEG